MKTTYIVSGFMRSGTSMMMQALSEGGLDPVISKSRDKMNLQWGDEYYKPNEGGFYELARGQYSELGFPEKYQGRLIKVLYGGVPKLCAGNYKIVFMLRDPEEIRQSYEAFFNRRAPVILEEYSQLVNYSVGIMENRKDYDYELLNYRDVVEEPLIIFDNLVDRGWQINPIEAASVVKPSLYRFRKEALMEGL